MSFVTLGVTGVFISFAVKVDTGIEACLTFSWFLAPFLMNFLIKV